MWHCAVWLTFTSTSEEHLQGQKSIPSKQRTCVPPKYWQISTRIHNITCQKTVFIVYAMRTSKL
jgi:hypothetical protein